MGSTCNSWIWRKQVLYVPMISFLQGLPVVRASLSQISITPVPIANNQLHVFHAFHAFCRNYLPTTSLRLLVSIMILLFNLGWKVCRVMEYPFHHWVPRPSTYVRYCTVSPTESALTWNQNGQLGSYSTIRLEWIYIVRRLFPGFIWCSCFWQPFSLSNEPTSFSCLWLGLLMPQILSRTSPTVIDLMSHFSRCWVILSRRKLSCWYWHFCRSPPGLTLSRIGSFPSLTP